MKVTWKTQPQQYQKKRYNVNPNKGTAFQKNSDSRYNSDFKKQDFTSTEEKRTQFQKNNKKHPKTKEDHYMASASVASSNIEENTLDLENFNYKDASDDILSVESSMHYMTPIEDMSLTESDRE